MGKTCIVCGSAAGSGEHVFPASLGGRRTDKNIYCATHDNGYSGLVADLSNQIDMLNAMLGVIPDHGKIPKSITVQDSTTGADVKISSDKSVFTSPRIISQEPYKEGVRAAIGFPDHESKNKWIAQQEKNHFETKSKQKVQVQPYFLEDIRLQRRLGGPCGLGAVAYVTQTFLAKAFPDLARSVDVAPFIAYTQAIAAVAQLRNGCIEAADEPADPKLEAAQHALETALAPWGGRAPVWWDFDPQPDATPNAFEFGHRVTVGVDASDGQIFGRFSLFSSLHFAVCFGKASSVIATKTVTVDIDPLAPHPPDDILRTESSSATARVRVPAEPTAGLAAAISSQSAETVMTNLLGRIEAHALAKCAAAMHAALVGGSSLPRVEREQLVARLIDREAQRVWNLAKYVLRGFRTQLPTEMDATLGSAIDAMTAHDPRSINGLSPMANASLALAKSALAAQMHEDLMAGRLDQRRIAELMGEGPGAAVVGHAVLEPVLMALRD